jgi:hypothetical protein
MQLFLLNKDPVENAYALPKHYLWPMTKELGQLMSSILHKNYSDKLGKYTLSRISKYIPQGPELREFILRYPKWIWLYYHTLQIRLINDLGWTYKKEGLCKADRIQQAFARCLNIPLYEHEIIPEKLEYGYFRYRKDYKVPWDALHTFRGYPQFNVLCVRPTKTVETSEKLPIDECVFLYTMYIDWKMSNK